MTNEQAIATAIDNFYTALNILFTGDGQPMKMAWDHTDSVTYMGPDGLYLIGWAQIERMWDTVAALRLGGRVNPQQLHTVIGIDMALITCIEAGENEMNGKVEAVSIRSSTAFHKKHDTWKVVGHQTDLLRYL